MLAARKQALAMLWCARLRVFCVLCRVCDRRTVDRVRAEPQPLRSSGFAVTPEGHDAARQPGDCLCDLKLVGMYLECRYCGTVYGNLREQWESRVVHSDKRR
jgi:hypothetical protein